MTTKTKKEARPTAEESAAKASEKTMRSAFSKDPLEHTFTMTIGDWSDDGHGKTAVIVVNCNKSLKAAQAAYKKSRAPSPEKLFAEYEESSLTQELYDEVFEAGYDLLAGFNEPKERARRKRDIPEETWETILEYPQVDPEELAIYVLWVCQQGDSTLKFSLGKELNDFFAHSGGGIGYGLFH